jgi:hypothetical protein
MRVSAPLVTNRQSPVTVQPGDSTFNYPAISPEPLAALYTLPRYPYLDAALTQSISASLGVVSLVGVQLLGALARPASACSFDRLYAVHHCLEHHRVVDVGPGVRGGQRSALPVYEDVVLRSRFAPVCRVWSCIGAPRGAATLAESTDALDQSI